MTIKEARNIVFTRDGNKCCECGSIELLCMDHVLPKPKFQLHSIDNIRTLCLRCNFRKTTKVLLGDELMRIFAYIDKANQQFTEEQVAEINAVLHEYFTQPKRKTQRRVSEYRPYARENKKRIPLWKQLRDMVNSN